MVRSCLKQQTSRCSKEARVGVEADAEPGRVRFFTMARTAAPERTKVGDPVASYPNRDTSEPRGWVLLTMTPGR